MKKFTSILLTGLLAVLSLTSMTASAATGDTTSDDVANIYVTDSYIDETNVPSPDSPALTAHVGDIIEVQVSCIATSDIKDFTTYDVRTYINQPSATERNRKITGNEGLLFKENGYGDGTFYTVYDGLNHKQASVITNPREDAEFPINHNDFIYTCSGIHNIGDFSVNRTLYTFTLEVVKPGDSYINTAVEEIAYLNFKEGLIIDSRLLKSNTIVSVLKKAEKPTEPEPTTVETEPTTEITEPVTQPTTMTEPVTEPTVTEPIESIPTVPDTEPTTSEPVTEPIETEPTYTEPIETDPVPTTESVETEPTTEEIPTEVVPTNPEPTSEPLTEPTTSEPVTEPTETEPVTSVPTTEPATTVNPTETVVPDTTKPTGANTEPTKAQDATSATGTPATPDTATKPSVNNTTNTNNTSGTTNGKTGFVTTGQALPVAYFALTAISAGVYLLTRKRKSKINK